LYSYAGESLLEPKPSKPQTPAAGGSKKVASPSAAGGGGGDAAAKPAPAKRASAAAPAPGGDDTSLDSRLLALEPSEPNPYEGWQPPIDDPSSLPSSSKCTFRDCLKGKRPRGCESLCRDAESQMVGPGEGMGPDAPKVSHDWVPDVTMLRRMHLRGRDAEGNIWPPSLPGVLCEDVAFDGGKKGDINKKCLDTIPVIGEPLTKSETQARADGLSNGKVAPEGTPMPKLMCLVYTMSSEHSTRIRAIRETWGGGCDGFLAFSTASDPRIPAISLEHEGPEEYGNMWQKVRSIWRFVAAHYLDEFDYFFIGGDDLFVMPQNLREYLWTLEGGSEADHFVGRRFKSHVYFNSGGAGYALSRSALRKLHSHMDESKCKAHTHTSMEDVMIAQCLSSLGIPFTDTRDDRGRERFHPFAPGSHLTWAYPKQKGSDWYETYNEEWGLKLGKECCAPDSVSWHYMKKPAMVRHIYSLLYLCGKVDMEGEGAGGAEGQSLRKRIGQ